jgi:hypothetical protein
MENATGGAACQRQGTQGFVRQDRRKTDIGCLIEPACAMLVMVAKYGRPVVVVMAVEESWQLEPHAHIG